MRAAFDRSTEGERERALLRVLRDPRSAPAAVRAAHLEFPVKLQIQTQSTCNASCAMCPWPDTARRLPQGRMEPDVYTRIVDQLAGRGVERVGLFLMNEPLLDPRLAEWTRLLKARVPETHALIYTNGLLLDGECARALADAGLDEVNVSIVDLDPELTEPLMTGVDHDRIRANLEQVGALFRAGDLGALRLRIVGLELPGAHEGAARLRERTGLEVFLKPVTNRAGLVDTSALGVPELADEPEPGAGFQPCQRPFVKAYFLYNGDMVLCNCDWERTTIVGNVRERDIASLWHDPLLERIREDQRARQPATDSPCARCDYPERL